MKKKLTKVIESDLLRDAYKKWRKQPKGGGRGREASKKQVFFFKVWRQPPSFPLPPCYTSLTYTNMLAR